MELPQRSSCYSVTIDTTGSSRVLLQSFPCSSDLRMDVPAVCGLKNQGNTCFMNAVIQCLSNTDLFAEYFVQDFYKIDRKKHCKINSRNGASRGEATEQLANLLKSLWSLRSHSDASYRFKQVVCKQGPQYQGSAQHDAQEFLLWLLDVIHEELNLSPRKLCKKINMVSSRIDDHNSPNGSLADHLRYNHSFIHDLFQSQVRSSLSCACGRQSTTVDPLLCFSLSIPTCLMNTVIVSVAYNDRCPQRIRVAVSVESRATLRELRDRISRQIRIPEKRLVLLHSHRDCGAAELSDDSQIIQDCLSDLEEVFAMETPAPVDEQADTLDLVVINRDKETKQIFGPLFSCAISRSSSFRKIQLELLQCLRPILNHSLDLNTLELDDVCLRLVVDSQETDQYLPPDVDHPFYMPIVDKAIAYCEDKEYRGPVHLNLILDWKPQVRQAIFVDPQLFPVYLSDPSAEVAAQSANKTAVSIYDCLDLYFREEKLLGENAWFCPSCKQRTASMKKLTLWTLPDIFIIHLKRFRQSSNMIRSKLSTPVTYPLTGLDMSPYMDDRSERNISRCASLRRESRTSPVHVRSRSAGRDSQSLPSRWMQPWTRPGLRWTRLNSNNENTCSTFDLVAVCNHTGSLLSGHYTSTCRNPVNLQWYHFDDTVVSPVKEAAVMSPNAYLLFYQRSSLSPANSCDSATSGYFSNDSHQSHWLSKNWSREAVSSRDIKIFEDSRDSGLCWSRTPSREDLRGSFPYATLPPAKTARKSIYKLLFSKKGRDSNALLTGRGREMNRNSSEQLIRPVGQLRVALPEESGDQKETEQRNTPTDFKSEVQTQNDKLFWTVTSV